ncbi:MAG: polyhydroxyalkanoic acid system family protein [Xanthobacteraceae bacterium]|nr:polyhydroxyalkanoic acid system family protein [Xanthobacteraceae bacterium]
MSQPLLVSIPHRLGREEATRRLKHGLRHARTSYAQWLTLEDESWNGDTVKFRARALGQVAAGRVDVFDDHVQLEVTLPWLLAKFAEKLVPTIRKEGTLMLEKK